MHIALGISSEKLQHKTVNNNKKMYSRSKDPDPQKKLCILNRCPEDGILILFSDPDPHPLLKLQIEKKQSKLVNLWTQQNLTL